MSDLYAGSRAQRLDAALHALLTATPELEAAAVVSFDGLPMASALPPGMDEDRVAAMSAALLSLGERAAQGLGRGALSQVYVEGEDGTVFLVSAQDIAVLVAVAARGAKTGLMLYEVKRGAAEVADVLRDVPFRATPPAAVPEPAFAPEPTFAPEPALFAEPVYAPGPVAGPEPFGLGGGPGRIDQAYAPPAPRPAPRYAPVRQPEPAYADALSPLAPSHGVPVDAPVAALPAVDTPWAGYAPSDPTAWS